MALITIKDPILAKRAKTGEASLMEVTDYLLNTYTVMDIAKAMAEILLMEDDVVKPIPISEEDFRRHFRLIGKKLGKDGEIVEELRGRKSGSKVVDGKVVVK